MAAVAALGRRARRWFPAAWNNHAGESEFPDEPTFVHYFAGLVSLADWIASNDAAGFFPYDGHGDGDRAGFSRNRAREVLRRMRVDVEDTRADLRLRAPAFGDVFRAPHGVPFAATALQQAMENAAHRRWAAEHPKRALTAAAAVGTIDQALLSGLPVRHAHLRGAALLRALIVADEVHASDAYMTQLLAGVLRRHVDAGGHALLLSVTRGRGLAATGLAECTRTSCRSRQRGGHWRRAPHTPSPRTTAPSWRRQPASRR